MVDYHRGANGWRRVLLNIVFCHSIPGYQETGFDDSLAGSELTGVVLPSMVFCVHEETFLKGGEPRRQIGVGT